MLKATSLSKRYGRLQALDNVTFELAPGEVLAVIGANGAGKTTLIKSLVGLLRFDGEAAVDGIDIRRNGKLARARIGYLAQHPALHSDLSVRETISFYAELRRAPQAQAQALMARVGLEDRAAALVSELSGGMRQRLGLAVALLGDPAVLILDEPASGLDISARVDLRELVSEQRNAGKSVLLSTHWLEDVPYVADRALLLDKGRLIYDGSSSALVTRLGASSRLYLRLNGHGREAIPVIEQFTAGRVGRSGDWVIARCPATQKARLVEALVTAGITILDFRVEEASVDETVLRMQGKERR